MPETTTCRHCNVEVDRFGTTWQHLVPGKRTAYVLCRSVSGTIAAATPPPLPERGATCPSA